MLVLHRLELGAGKFTGRSCRRWR